MDTIFDVIWYSGWIFSSQSHTRPSWFGFMQQSVYKIEVEFQQSDVLILPIIDLPPTDLYKTKEMNILRPCVTFDEPL